MKVVLAVDDTRSSDAAVRAAGRLFAAADPEFVVVTAADAGAPVVLDPLGLVPARDDDSAPQRSIRSERTAADVATSAAAALPNARTRTVAGNAVDGIAVVAEEENADVVVVGTEDKGLLQRLVDPPVSSGLIRRTHRPVLVVHADG